MTSEAMTDPAITPVAGKPNMVIGAYDVATLGYTLEEFFVSGTASSYSPVTQLGPDGRWDAEPSDRAEYTTRCVVLRPTDPATFNGTAIVEWLNVSGGIDAPAVWMMAHREVVRAGYAYVAVSAQKVGVDGGTNMLGMDMSLKTQNPERYSPLGHPGDAFSYDIFSQVGRLVRGGGLLGELQPDFVVAVGESQSAMYLTTYINAVDPLANVYDGFLVHSRFGPAAPLDGNSIFETSGAPQAVKFRPDLRVPLLTVITETDVVSGQLVGYYFARQSDNDLLRVWEIPGAAHADNYTICVAPFDTGVDSMDRIVAGFAPTKTLLGQELSHYINFAPQHHYVLQAALAGLHDWVRTGTPPPSAPPMEVADGNPPQLIADEHGLTKGGVRTPWVDVPIARTSGVGNDDNQLATIFGSGEPFDAATLERLYPGGKAEYLARFNASLDETIRTGFLLDADRHEILELAAASYPQA